MKTIKNHLFSLYYVTILLLACSCQNEDLDIYEENTNYRNAADFIKNNLGLTLFSAALEKTGVLEELRQEGLMTVFAPDDNAFHAVGIYDASDFDRLDQDSLRTMLRYYILNRALFTADVPEQSVDNRYLNKSGKELYVSGYALAPQPEYMYFYVNGAKIVSPDQVLSNGVLHIVDKLLKYEEKNIQEALETRPEFSYFVAAMKQFGYWGQLAEEGPWIVFAPRNEAFENWGVSLDDIQSMDPKDYLPRLFRSYFFKNQLFVTDLRVLFKEEGYPYYNGNNVMVPVEGDLEVSSGFYTDYDANAYLFLTESMSSEYNPMGEVMHFNLTDLDHLTNNGIWHAIDDLLIAPADALK